MSRTGLLLPTLALLLTAPLHKAHALPVDDTARLLAGLAPDALPADGPRKKQLASFGKTVTEKWGGYWKKIGQPMTDWARTELPQTPGETIFYPFSGPDFPTAVQLYPDAGRYVLVAIQNAGRVPDLEELASKTPEAFDAYIALMKDGWIDFARRGFFRTEDLKATTGKGNTLEGVTPVLMAFAARLGFKVDAVDPLRVRADGTEVELHPGPRDDAATWKSVRLSLSKEGRKVLLDYILIDLSDAGLGKAKEARAFLEAMASHKVFTKAASHLMQKPFFSEIRDILLTRAPSILQDETGVDYKDLGKSFDVALYGRFNKTHKLWKSGEQSSLIEAYRTRKDIKPLSFKFGYEKDAGYCIMVATRKSR
jgi:hypothetical protein